MHEFIRKYLLAILVLAVFSLCLAPRTLLSDEKPGMIGAAPIEGTKAKQAEGSTAKKESQEEYKPDTALDVSLYNKAGHRSNEWNEFIEPGFQTFDADNFATAYVFLQKAYDRGCRDGLLLYRLGIYKESKGKYSEAADMLATAADKIPKQYPSHYLAKGIQKHAGRALYQNGDYERALPYLEAAAANKSGDVMTLFMAGQILRKSGKNEEAKKYLTDALAMDKPPEIETQLSKTILTELVVLTFEAKELDQCEAYADKILQFFPDDRIAKSYKDKIVNERHKKEQEEMIKKVIQ